MKKTYFFILSIGVISTCFGKEPERLRRDESFLGIHFDFHAGNPLYDMEVVGKNTTPKMIHKIIDMVHPDYIQIDC
jgi:hypothetical protein